HAGGASETSIPHLCNISLPSLYGSRRQSVSWSGAALLGLRLLALGLRSRRGAFHRARGLTPRLVLPGRVALLIGDVHMHRSAQGHGELDHGRQGEIGVPTQELGDVGPR